MTQIRRGVLFGVVVFFSFLVGGIVQARPAVRISLPPMLESLPLAFASEWGIFEEYDVSVELIGITDNQERSSALLTGNLDAILGDVTRSLLDISGGWDVVITGAASSRPQTGSLRVALLGHESFGIDSFDSLVSSGLMIGTNYRSDYEYLLDEVMIDHGSADAWMSRYMYFNDMLQVAIWFGAETIPAAVLPEPYISYIANYTLPSGRIPVIVTLSDFSSIEVPPVPIVFNRTFVRRNPDTVERFFAAYAAAIERLNATPREELIEVGIDVVLSLFFQGANKDTIPQESIDAITIPYFNPLTPLDRALFDLIGGWMKDKGYLRVVPEYDDAVDHRYLP